MQIRPFSRISLTFSLHTWAINLRHCMHCDNISDVYCFCYSQDFFIRVAKEVKRFILLVENLPATPTLHHTTQTVCPASLKLVVGHLTFTRKLHFRVVYRLWTNTRFCDLIELNCGTSIELAAKVLGTLGLSFGTDLLQLSLESFKKGLDDLLSSKGTRTANT